MKIKGVPERRRSAGNLWGNLCGNPWWNPWGPLWGPLRERHQEPLKEASNAENLHSLEHHCGLDISPLYLYTFARVCVCWTVGFDNHTCGCVLFDNGENETAALSPWFPLSLQQ